MHQREDVADKYEGIYGTIDALVADVVRRSPLPPKETYARLKLAVPASWAIANWSADHSGVPTEAEHARFGHTFLNAPATWQSDGSPASGTRSDYIKAADALFARTFAERLKGSDMILDLGCGWGHRMVDIHFQGVDAQFVGGDRSEHSGNIVRSLARLFPAARLDWFRFDFLNPDFSAVPTTFKKIGVISCHAIEQVEVLGSAMFDALLRRFPAAEIRGVHIEPVAAQIDPSRTVERAYATRRRYNLDLLTVVQDHPAISLMEAKAAIHDGGDANPSSLIVWTHTP